MASILSPARRRARSASETFLSLEARDRRHSARLLSPVDASVIAEFWRGAKGVVPALPETPPGSDRIWGFGATPQQADGLLALVLTGMKTATTGYLEEYEAESLAVEQIGDLDILLDGSDVPRAIIETTEVDVVPFDKVTAEHAFAEGEDDRTLASWRRIHRDFYEKFVAPDVAFRDDAPVVCQRFRVVYPPIPRED